MAGESTTETSTGAQAAPSFTASLLVAGALLIVFLLGLRSVSSSEIWLHLAAGRHALEHGPAQIDPFSYALPANTPWLQRTWLYDVAVHGLWSAGGSGLAVLFHAGLAVMAFVLLIPLVRRYGSDLAIAGAIVLCGWLMAPALVMRPVLLTLPLVALVLRMASGRLTWARLAGLAGVQILWANTAPWMLLGPLIAVLRGMEQRRRMEGDTPASRYFAAGAVMLLACAVNPFGFRMLADSVTAISQLQAPVSLEWISPFAREFLGYPLASLSTIVLVLIAVVFIFHRQALPLAPTVLAVLAAFHLVQSSLHIELDAVLAFPFVVMALSALGRLAALRLSAGVIHSAGAATLAMAIAVSGWSIITNRYYIASGSASAFGWKVNTDAFPVAATETLKRLDRKPGRMINLAHDGGYLLWRMPGAKVFTDPRGGLYGTAFFDLLSRGLVGHEESWKKLIETYDPDALLIPGTWTGAGATAFRLLQGEQWAMAYFDGTTMLIVRSTSANRALLDDADGRRRGLQLIDEARQRYERHMDNAFVRPPNPSRLIGASTVYQALGRFENALPLHRLLTQGSPRYVGAWVNRGIAEIQSGDATSALTTLQEVTRLIPANPIGWLWLGKAHKAAGHEHDATTAFDRARAINRVIAERFLAEESPPPAP